MPAKELATAILELQREIEEDRHMLELEERLLRTLVEEDLPDAMAAEDLTMLKLEDGTTIEVETTYHGSISEANKEAALKWLIDQKMDRLIKRQVTIQFGMGALEDAIRLGNVIKKHLPGHPLEIQWHGAQTTGEAEARVAGAVELVLGPDHGLTWKDTVHPSTLKSFIQKQMEKGTAFPAELFGAFRRTAAVFRRPPEPSPADDGGVLEQQLKDSLSTSGAVS